MTMQVCQCHMKILASSCAGEDDLSTSEGPDESSSIRYHRTGILVTNLHLEQRAP